MKQAKMRLYIYIYIYIMGFGRDLILAIPSALLCQRSSFTDHPIPEVVVHRLEEVLVVGRTVEGVLQVPERHTGSFDRQFDEVRGVLVVQMVDNLRLTSSAASAATSALRRFLHLSRLSINQPQRLRTYGRSLSSPLKFIFTSVICSSLCSLSLSLHQHPIWRPAPVSGQCELVRAFVICTQMFTYLCRFVCHQFDFIYFIVFYYVMVNEY